MKKVAKTALFLTVAFVLVLCACALCACDTDVTESGEKNVTVTVGESVITANTDALYLNELLEELKADGKLAVYTTEGDGATEYITSIGELNPNPANEYVSIYHTIDDITLKGTDWQTGEFLEKDVNGIKYFYSGVGISSLPVHDGASYLFVLEQF